jgi:predicted permease
VQQLFIESVLLSVLGGVLAIGVAYAGVHVFRQFQIPTDLPVVPSFDLDRRALLVGLVVSVVSAVLFGMTPALRSTRGDLTAVLKAPDAFGSGRLRWGRALLVGGQVAVSVTLLVIATLMYRSFQELIAHGPGYRTDHLLQMTLDPTLLGYTPVQAQQFFDRVAERARAVPGVKSIALASSAPSDIGPSSAMTVLPDGVQLMPDQERIRALTSIVDEHYFAIARIPIVSGRLFTASDSATSPRVAIINEHLAQLYWSGQDPIGKRLRVGDSNEPPVEIVGVAKTAKYVALSESPIPLVYLAYKQRPQKRMTVLAESLGDPKDLAAPLRDLVRGLDANQPVYNVRSVGESYRMRMVTIFDVVVELVAAMGVAGLGLALVGLYGLVAYAANRRTREIGIRMAIGANRTTVLLMVVRQGITLSIVGLTVGLCAGAGARYAMRAAFGLGRDIDLLGFILVAAVVLAVTLLAAYVPARRASRINPMVALRCE